jgi:hypothetical protein
VIQRKNNVLIVITRNKSNVDRRPNFLFTDSVGESSLATAAAATVVILKQNYTNECRYS